MYISIAVWWGDVITLCCLYLVDDEWYLCKGHGSLCCGEEREKIPFSFSQCFAEAIFKTFFLRTFLRTAEVFILQEIILEQDFYSCGKLVCLRRVP